MKTCCANHNQGGSILYTNVSSVSKHTSDCEGAIRNIRNLHEIPDWILGKNNAINRRN